ncbi:MAG: aminotransferase class III-fold pyridoxal phosphate-dependent enzyme, partial [Alphaproteobacteria bacterium]|nr:aminotransferase class III-fold pyridoxal phosphate-dependent enzyme [Alphaproteobacteria bacterium]
NFKNGFGPFMPGNHIVPYANPYHPPKGATAENCAEICIEIAREQLRSNSSGGIAAFLIEPCQGTAGNVIPPDNFLPMVCDLAKEFDALVIADEMITGFGRTGRYWGCDHSGIIPDILTVGKQFGGGFPLSGVISTEKITSTKPWGNPSGSSSSYGGNPLAAAAAHASLSIIEQEDLVKNSRETGQYFLEKISHFKEKYSFIGDVRGRGLLLAIEMVADKETREPLSLDITNRIFNEFLQKGLLTMAYTARFRIQPAMTIDRGTIDNIVTIMEDVFQITEEKYL